MLLFGGGVSSQVLAWLLGHVLIGLAVIGRQDLRVSSGVGNKGGGKREGANMADTD